ncbi:AAA family ATPase [Kitasatospora sp. MY 5-36]|uniref:AAA family ATPase n=1 Tax=Kitasatospora sp. MY 5-36 TaxID=1678027 RepID=UPI0006709103|nr:AAA family ATPase [Kitasatospora sp. MY 5-36]
MTTAPPPTDAGSPFITRVQITNYKSIARCDVPLGPFTVLLGLNAAGKSNFLDALSFVRDAVTRGPADAIGSRVGLENVLRRAPESAPSCTITLDFRLPPSPGQDTPWRGRYGFTIARGSGPHAPQGWEVRHEICELGVLGSDRPPFRFEVERGIVNDPASEREAVMRAGSLYLPMLGGTGPYALLYAALSDMFFYAPDLAALRDARPATGSDGLDEDGGHLGAVLGLLDPWASERVSAYAGAIVPNLTEVGPSGTAAAGDYVAARMTLTSGSGSGQFRAESMSEGTIRAIGLLTALFQPRARDGRIPLVAIEEPELALHPLAAGVLFDALTEASASVQVLATSQSAELFDRKEADLSAIRVVTARDGVTVIGPVDEVSQSIVADGLATVGELLRSNQLEPQLPQSEQGEPAE